MVSAINPNLIDITYPISGQDNDTAGFRTNYTNIKTNFTTAASEITSLQTNAAIINGTNDFGGNIIQNAELLDNSLTVNNIGPSTGVVNINHTAGHVVVLSQTGAITLAFSGWPVAGKLGSILIELTTSGGLGVTLPGVVVVPPDFKITTDGNSTYWYEFITRDAGATIYLIDHTRSYGLNTGTLDISGNTISSTVTNGDINITPNGSGTVNISSLTLPSLSLTDITIIGNVINTTILNSNLVLEANGVGVLTINQTNVTINSVTVGSPATLVMSHNDNTNINSDVSITLESGGIAGGDSFISTTVTGGAIGWSFGLDNLDNDKFKISRGTNNLSSNVSLEIDHTTFDVTIANNLNVAGTLSVLGGQVIFPATQTPSANVNTLDDYEEGTWTPVLTYGTPGTLALTYTTQSGKYTKIGNSITLTCAIRLATFVKGTATGDLIISGLPFASAHGANVGTVAPIMTFNAPFTSQPLAMIEDAVSVIQLRRSVTNAVWVALDDPDANSEYFFTISYYTA